MNFLPIAHRELRQAARQPATYYSRSGAALLAASLGIGLVLAGFARVVNPTSAGQGVFYAMSLGAYFFATFQATLLTCDCISLERREGTLGFLFLTTLSGHDVVLGKLARLTRPLGCLLAIVPALGFALFLGGVSLGDLVRTGLGLMNALFFFAALGILISARHWNERRATVAAMFSYLAFNGLLPVLGLLFGPAGNGALFLILTPVGTLAAGLGHGFVSGEIFIKSLVLTHLLGWLFIVVAGRTVSRFLEAPLERITSDKKIANRAPSRLQFEDKIVSAIALRQLGFFVLLSGLMFWASTWPKLVMVIIGWHIVLKFLVADQACRAMARKRQSGELELLLTTPRHDGDILRANLIGLKRQLLAPVIFVLAVDFAAIAIEWWRSGFADGFSWAVGLAFEIIFMLANLYAIAWVGLWMGIKSATHAKAVGRTLFCVVFLPWFGLIFLAGAIAGRLPSFMGPLAIVFFVLMSVLCNLGFAGLAISELRDRLRILAAS